MAASMAAAPSGRRLTPKIRELVAADRHARPAVGRLTAAHVEALTAVATRAEAFDEAVLPARALQALAAGAPADVAVPVLSRVLAAAAAPRTDRVTAARELAGLATPAAHDALAGAIRDRDPRVQQVAVAALGKLGGPADLREMMRMVEPGDLSVRKQLRFARALIAHRHGLDGPFLPEVEGVERRPGAPERMITLTLRPRGTRGTATDLARHLGSTYGIVPAAQSFSLRAGRAEWAVFVNGEVGASASGLARLFERPWIAAILGRWFPANIANTTQYVVLTRPVAGGARIDVVRTDGELMYTGTAEQLAGTIAFAMADVDRPGTAPTTVRGRVSGRGLELELTVPFATRVGTRPTEAVRPRG
ncbi:MAG: HEAT repeat domain-containing protein [Dehalococcoidia bacterium]